MKLFTVKMVLVIDVDGDYATTEEEAIEQALEDIAQNGADAYCPDGPKVTELEIEDSER